MQKFLKFLFGIVILTGVKCEANMEKFEAVINQTLEACRVAENASIEDAMILYSDDTSWPETKEGKCLIECFFEEVGIVSKTHKILSKILISKIFSLKIINSTNEVFYLWR